MNSSPRTLRHLLYTNSAGADGEGFRLIATAFGGTREGTQTVGRWLLTLTGSSAGSRAWAAASFLIDGTLHAALAVFEPRFGWDDGGRKASLAHALLVPADPGELGGDFGTALFEQANRFTTLEQAGPVSLDRYLQGCELFQEILVPDLDPAGLCRMDPSFLRTLLATSSRAQGDDLPREIHFPGVTDEERLPELIVQASAALPPRLRLALRWGVGFQPNDQMFVARLQGGSGSGVEQTGASAAYFEWLQAHLAAGRFDEILKIVRNWEIIEWPRLEQAIATAAPGQREEDEAMRKRRGDPSPAMSAGDTPRSPEAYEAEYQAVAAAVMDYVDKRLRRFSAAEVSREEWPSPGGATPWWQRLRRLRYDLYFLILILLLLRLINLSSVKSSSAPVGPAASAETPADNDGSATPAAGATVTGTTTDQDAFQSWETFLKSEHADQWFKELAKPTKLPPAQVTQEVRDKAAIWAARRETGGTPLTDDALTALFEYVHARWAQDIGNPEPRKNWISLDAGEVTAEHLSGLIGYLELTGTLDAKPDDRNVREKVVLTYLQRNPLH